MPDQTLTCSDCNQAFLFTEQEQAFFQEKNFAPPKRCPDCRKARRSQQQQGPPRGADRPHSEHRGHAGGGARGPRVGGGGHGGGHPGGGGGGGGFRPRTDRPPMGKFRIVCDGCGQEATVPFEPAPGRPVYCQACYKDRRTR